MQIYSTAVALTLGSHEANLASSVQDARFVSSTEFDFTVAGLALSSAAGNRTTSATGAVSEVDLVPADTGTDVRVLFRTPESHDQVAVGAGTTIQVSFS